MEYERDEIAFQHDNMNSIGNAFKKSLEIVMNNEQEDQI